MKVMKVITGDLEENCYIIIKDNDVLIVDPGDDIDLILNEIKDLNLIGILITHYHFDHIGALKDLIKYKNVPIYDYKLKEKEYNIESFNFNIIYTKGHTDDSITFYFKKHKIMFTGDFIFKGTIGRTDLETGNMTNMKSSIDMIKKYDEDIIIYPGHGDSTTLKDEIENNYYFKIS